MCSDASCRKRGKRMVRNSFVQVVSWAVAAMSTHTPKKVLLVAIFTMELPSSSEALSAPVGKKLCNNEVSDFSNRARSARTETGSPPNALGSSDGRELCNVHGIGLLHVACLCMHITAQLLQPLAVVRGVNRRDQICVHSSCARTGFPHFGRRAVGHNVNGNIAIRSHRLPHAVRDASLEWEATWAG